jgi:hypothetical protein
MITEFDRQPQREDAKCNTYGINVKTYSKGPASYLRSWTGVPRAEVGGPGISGMPLAITVRTTISDFSRQIGL